MARWLCPPAEASYAFMIRAFSPPWEGPLGVDGGGEASGPVSWEPVPPRREGCPWKHEITRCSRPVPLPEQGDLQEAEEGAWEAEVGGALAAPCHVCVHRLTLAAGQAEELNRSLAAIALEREEAALGCARDASNIGGFHSEVDMLAWEELRSSPLQALLDEALVEVDRFESAGVGREPCVFEEKPEAWMNVSRDGHWNHLHSHPGSTFSGTYYVSDGGCCDREVNSLSGRLVLVPAAPPRLARHNLEHLHRSAGVGHIGGEASEEGALTFLALDPIPGTLLIFPSFLPHFVLPVQRSLEGVDAVAADAAGMGPRISLAFNFVSR